MSWEISELPAEALRKLDLASHYKFGPARPSAPLPHWLTGNATFTVLKQAIDELEKKAPQDCDVVIAAFNLMVLEVRFIEPHTFIFYGITDDGKQASAVFHFTQLVAHVVYQPKRGPNRVITGFAQGG